MIDFPMDLALKAYANNPDPQKRAERDRTDFQAHLDETRVKLEGLAKTDAQREHIEHQMRVYTTSRLGEWRKVLQSASNIDWNDLNDKGLTRFGQTHLGFLGWDRKYAARMEQELLGVGQPWVGRVQRSEVTLSV